MQKQQNDQKIQLSSKKNDKIINQNVMYSLNDQNQYFTDQVDINCFQHILEHSFELASKNQHIKSLKKAQNIYLTSVLGTQIEEKKGFNDENFFKNYEEQQNLNSTSLKEIISKSKFLKKCQTVYWLQNLRSEINLGDFLSSLSSQYNAKIFDEMIYIFHSIWKKYKLFKSQHLINDEIKSIPCLLDFNHSSQLKFNQVFKWISLEELQKQANNCSEQLLTEIYFDQKILYLTMNSLFNDRKTSIYTAFGVYLKTIAKIIFLISQGYFQFNQNPQDYSSTSLQFGFQFSESFNISEESQRSFGQDRKNYDTLKQGKNKKNKH